MSLTCATPHASPLPITSLGSLRSRGFPVYLVSFTPLPFRLLALDLASSGAFLLQVLNPFAHVACFDGASRGNGQAALRRAGAGVVIATDSGTLVSGGIFLGDVSNNVAEFTAMAAACQVLADLRAMHAVLVGDSLIAIDAVSGSCSVHHSVLAKLVWESRCWLASLGS